MYILFNSQNLIDTVFSTSAYYHVFENFMYKFYRAAMNLNRSFLNYINTKNTVCVSMWCVSGYVFFQINLPGYRKLGSQAYWALMPELNLCFVRNGNISEIPRCCCTGHSQSQLIGASVSLNRQYKIAELSQHNYVHCVFLNCRQV